MNHMRIYTRFTHYLSPNKNPTKSEDLDPKTDRFLQGLGHRQRRPSPTPSLCSSSWPAPEPRPSAAPPWRAASCGSRSGWDRWRTVENCFFLFFAGNKRENSWENWDFVGEKKGNFLGKCVFFSPKIWIFPRKTRFLGRFYVDFELVK